MMTALMYKKPENHIQFLEECLDKAKQDPKVRWHSFIEPLPPIPKATDKIQPEAVSSTEGKDSGENAVENNNINGAKQQTPVVVQKKDEANSLAEQVFQKHMNEINSLDDDDKDDASTEEERPWYADYTERRIDTSIIQGKPIVFVLGTSFHYSYLLLVVVFLVIDPKKSTFDVYSS